MSIMTLKEVFIKSYFPISARLFSLIPQGNIDIFHCKEYSPIRKKIVPVNADIMNQKRQKRYKYAESKEPDF